MAAAVKISAGKSVDIVLAFAPERDLYITIAFVKQSAYFNAFNRERVIYQPFDIAFLVIELVQLLFI